MSKLLAFALCDVSVGLLLVAGIMKLSDATTVVGVFSTLRLPARRSWSSVARVLGLGEIAVAVSVVAFGGRATFVALALLYVAFAVVSGVLLARGGADCGCFGVRSAPITRVHVVVNVVLAAGAVLATVLDAPSTLQRLDAGTALGVTYVAFVALGTVVFVALLTSAAELVAVRRSVTPRDA
ncbi:MAG: MauE/DoxX family redox-associated membrane protein [Acidimicrobiales bacterium]